MPAKVWQVVFRICARSDDPAMFVVVKILGHVRCPYPQLFPQIEGIASVVMWTTLTVNMAGTSIMRSSSPLGPPASWPQSQRSVVGLLLGSKPKDIESCCGVAFSLVILRGNAARAAAIGTCPAVVRRGRSKQTAQERLRVLLAARRAKPER